MRRFWEDLYPYLVAHGHPWAQGRLATTNYWISSNVGKTGVMVTVALVRDPPQVDVSIWLERDAANKHVVKEQFDLLVANRAGIEAEFQGEGDAKTSRQYEK